MKLLKIQVLAIALLFFLPENASAFCGFYVAKAGAELYNESSQVIMVRDGNKTVITMANDFKGNVKDFAMVVPVPTILKEDQIRVSRKDLFDRLDLYSAPRLVEYYDQNPCQEMYLESVVTTGSIRNMSGRGKSNADKPDKDYNVKIEAEYTIGEYDILILSAQESGGLERWLVDNGYKIPSGAQEVLEPYIKSEMKFFVVKVNLENQQKTGFNYLRPLQIEFESGKFMLPIRLGMANAKDWQDLIIYVLAKDGRVETTNYRTVKIPTDRDIPDFLKPHFPNFYKDLYAKTWGNEGQNAVFLEYAWDLSGYQPVKCDPCNGPPPVVQDMKDAGVFWVNYNSNGYEGNVHFTRLHLRYNREKFPQDLFFQNTPNKEHFQGRYIMRHPAQGEIKCKEGIDYLRSLVNRRQRELQELTALTGWDNSSHKDYVQKYASMLAELDKKQAQDSKNFLPIFGPQLPGGTNPWVPVGAVLLAFFCLLLTLRYFRKTMAVSK